MLSSFFMQMETTKQLVEEEAAKKTKVGAIPEVVRRNQGHLSMLI